MTSRPSLGSRGHEHPPQLLLQLRLARLELVGLGREGGVFGRQLAGRLLVVLGLPPLGVGVDDGGQLGVAPAEVAGLVLVGVHAGVGQGALQLRVLGRQLAEPVEHCSASV